MRNTRYTVGILTSQRHIHRRVHTLHSADTLRVETLQLGHGESVGIDVGFVEQFNTRNSISICFLREFRGQILQNIQTPIGVRRIGGKENRTDESRASIAILRSRRAVQDDHHGETKLVGPLYSLDKVWVLCGIGI